MKELCLRTLSIVQFFFQNNCTKSMNMILSSAIQHRQNLLELINKYSLFKLGAGVAQSV
jgi:hypothetical protein